MIMQNFEEKCRILNYELFFLHTVSKSIKESLDENRILSVILTGLTANAALGLSRAAVFYYSPEKAVIYGKKGIGPFDEEEAFRIWDDLGQNLISLETYLQHDTDLPDRHQRYPSLIKNIVINFDELPPENYFRRVIEEKKLFHLKDTGNLALLPQEIKNVFVPSDMIILPLSSPKNTRGIIMADNAFHHKPIEESTMLLLSLITIQAGLALENSSNYSIIKTQLEEVKELKNALENLQEELVQKEKLSTIGKMASYFIHEIKNPLVTIGGFAKHIKESDDIAIMKRDAGIIFKEIQKLEQILGKISGFTFLSPSRKEKVNILEVIKEVVEFFGLEFSRKKIEVSINIPENLKVTAERVQLTEVFFNIISNAIENTTKGRISVSSEINPPFASIFVKDTGRGIAGRDLPRITEPFFSTKSEGFGLGLYIVKNILSNNGGNIEISSIQGEGTEVKVDLVI
ncbi:MAG TPA: HAMP domain-containing sensor histidine kinase [bacterium]|nr:HAMP domain-containing sensor histidine kinase [bacterium]